MKKDRHKPGRILVFKLIVLPSSSYSPTRFPRSLLLEAFSNVKKVVPYVASFSYRGCGITSVAFFFPELLYGTVLNPAGPTFSTIKFIFIQFLPRLFSLNISGVIGMSFIVIANTSTSGHRDPKLVPSSIAPLCFKGLTASVIRSICCIRSILVPFP